MTGTARAAWASSPPAPPPFGPLPVEAGGRARWERPKLRIGKLVWPPLPPPARGLGRGGGGAGLQGRVAAPRPPHARPTLGARGSGGQEGEEEPPAAPGRQLHGAHCGSGPMARAGPGCEGAGRLAWGLCSALGARRRGLSAPQLHSCTSSRQPSSSTSSASRDWERARSRLAPPTPSTAFQRVPGSGNSQLHFLPRRAGLGCAPPGARTPGLPARFSRVPTENPKAGDGDRHPPTHPHGGGGSLGQRLQAAILNVPLSRRFYRRRSRQDVCTLLHHTPIFKSIK